MKYAFFSPVSYAIGQALVKRMGLWAAARYLRNLGVPVELAVEYLAVKAPKDYKKER